MDKKRLDISCCYCGRKYNLAEQAELLNIDETVAGKVLYCSNPKCEQQSIIKE